MNHTLDQIRATHALGFVQGRQRAFQGDEGGKIVAKMPSYIVNNGLLSTLAFAKSKRGDFEAIMLAVADHLAQKEVGLLTSQQRTSLAAFIDALSKAEARVLRHATAETLAYLNYLKRFAS